MDEENINHRFQQLYLLRVKAIGPTPTAWFIAGQPLH